MTFQVFEQKQVIKVAAWYAAKYPTDAAMAQRIDPDVTFDGLYHCIENGYYSSHAFFAGDSVARERILAGLAAYYHTTCQDMYNRFSEAVCVDPGYSLVPFCATWEEETDNKKGIIKITANGQTYEFGRTHEGKKRYFYTPVHPVYTSTPLGVSAIWLAPSRAAQLQSDPCNPFRYLSTNYSDVEDAYLD